MFKRFTSLLNNKSIFLALMMLVVYSGLFSQSTQWQQVQRTGNQYNAVHFYDANNGWAVGNGGRTTRINSVTPTLTDYTAGTVAFTGVYAVSNTEAYATKSGSGVPVYSWNNGTSTWVSLNNTNGFDFYGVAKTGSFVVVVGGDPNSQDESRIDRWNGTSWTTVYNNGTNNRILRAVSFSGANGYAVGDGGRILRSTDNGGTWATVTGTGLPGGVAWSGVFLLSTNSYVYIVGPNGQIYYSINNGANWSAQTSGVSAALESVFFTGASTGWVVGAGGTVLNQTSGTSWSATPTSPQTDALYGVHITNSTPATADGWAVGANGLIIRLRPVAPPPTVSSVSPNNGPATIITPLL